MPQCLDKHPVYCLIRSTQAPHSISNRSSNSCLMNAVWSCAQDRTEAICRGFRASSGRLSLSLFFRTYLHNDRRPFLQGLEIPLATIMTTSRIVDLSQRIAANTAKVHNYLAAHNLPEPSFALDAPLVSVIPQANTDLVKARQEVINDTLELRQLMLGPKEHLTSFSVCVCILILCVT